MNNPDMNNPIVMMAVIIFGLMFLWWLCTMPAAPIVRMIQGIARLFRRAPQDIYAADNADDDEEEEDQPQQQPDPEEEEPGTNNPRYHSQRFNPDAKKTKEIRANLTNKLPDPEDLQQHIASVATQTTPVIVTQVQKLTEGRNIKLRLIYDEDPNLFRIVVNGLLNYCVTLAHEQGKITVNTMTDKEHRYYLSRGNFDDLLAPGGLFWKAEIVGMAVSDNKSTVFGDRNGLIVVEIPYDDGQKSIFLDGSAAVLNDWLDNKKNWESIPGILDRKKLEATAASR